MQTIKHLRGNISLKCSEIKLYKIASDTKNEIAVCYIIQYYDWFENNEKRNKFSGKAYALIFVMNLLPSLYKYKNRYKNTSMTLSQPKTFR